MRLAAARPSDAVRLARIMGGWTDETDWMPKLHSHADNVKFLQRLIRDLDVTVLRNWRGAQGFLARNGAEVDALYLAPGARGRGMGTRLIDRAKAASERLELWCFQANTGALRFYDRQGFVEAERTDGAGNDEKLPDVRLVWAAAGEDR